MQNTEQLFLIGRNKQQMYKLQLISTSHQQLRYLNTILLRPQQARSAFVTVKNSLLYRSVYKLSVTVRGRNTKEIAGKKNSRRTKLTKAT